VKIWLFNWVASISQNLIDSVIADDKMTDSTRLIVHTRDMDTRHLINTKQLGRKYASKYICIAQKITVTLETNFFRVKSKIHVVILL